MSAGGGCPLASRTKGKLTADGDGDGDAEAEERESAMELERERSLDSEANRWLADELSAAIADALRNDPSMQCLEKPSVFAGAQEPRSAQVL